MVLPKNNQVPIHQQFTDLLNILKPTDVLVLNDTCVLPARLQGRKEDTGGKVEALLSRPLADNHWVALLKSSKKMKPETRLVFEGENSASLRATVGTAVKHEPGAYEILFHDDVRTFAQHYGEIPLPPYMRREADEEDTQRYQTVFAKPENNFAAAAPTAGLHFDDAFLLEAQRKGIEVIKVTLHVGPGTFLPVRDEDVTNHLMHAEPWSLSEEAAQKINAAKDDGKRIIAVGTTSIRVLEAAVDPASGRLKSGSGLTRLFIRPGSQFSIVDGFLTNFHLPKSTLLMLVAAAVGRENLLNAYSEAIEKEYRFFSYGDACFFEVCQKNQKRWPKS